MISDRQIYWNRHRLFLPCAMWQGGSIAGGMLLSEVSIGAGTSTLMKYQGATWDGSGTTGYQQTSVVQGKFIVPKNFNPEHPLGFRLHYTLQVDSSTSTVLLPTLQINFKSMTSGLLGAAASGVLNTIIPAKTGQLLKGIYTLSGRGILNGNWSNRVNVFAGQWMEFSLLWTTLTGYTLSATALPNGARLWVLGMEIDYVPMMTRFPHSEIDAPEDDAMV